MCDPGDPVKSLPQEDTKFQTYAQCHFTIDGRGIHGHESDVLHRSSRRSTILLHLVHKNSSSMRIDGKTTDFSGVNHLTILGRVGIGRMTADDLSHRRENGGLRLGRGRRFVLSVVE
jgi:hypothetical protein